MTIILNELLTRRSRRERLEKLNMVIGTFFSEVGTTLLAEISDCDPGLDGIRKRLLVRDTWQDQEFDDLKSFLDGYHYDIDINKIEIRELTSFLNEKRNFLLRLLENPVLLEHQKFTETLRTVFHLTEELEMRSGSGELPPSDLSQINGDLVRVYRNTSIQWVNYMK